jgi:hypothetical protein
MGLSPKFCSRDFLNQQSRNLPKFFLVSGGLLLEPSLYPPAALAGILLFQ